VLEFSAPAKPTSLADSAVELGAGDTVRAAKPRWNYDEAFSRNLGLVSPAEQARLRRARVAIAGMGGVGGVHLATLARLGVGNFTIADPDVFEIANTNRQYGATVDAVGRPKAPTMAAEALRIFNEPITAANVDDFLADADVYVDGIDFFALRARRVVFRRVRELGLWGVTAGPVGFSTAWLNFDPAGMPFDEYFDLRDGQDELEQTLLFALGLAPRMTQRSYLDLNYVDLAAHRGPSAALACQLCSGIAAAEVLKILLDRGPLRAAPEYAQFDAYRGILRRGRLRGGNRHLAQRLKRYWLARRLRTTTGPAT
jgi:ThiF family